MTTNSTCLIWNTPATNHPTARDGTCRDSPRAGGKYFIASTAERVLAQLMEAEKVKLTSWLIEQRRSGVSCPEVTSATLDDVTQRRDPSVHDRADSLLRYLASRSRLLGHVVKFYPMDNSGPLHVENELLAWTGSRKMSEVIMLVEYCKTERWIEYRANWTNEPPYHRGPAHGLMLQPPGYAKLAALDGSGATSTQAFVAMWFDKSMDDAYSNGISPAIRDAGYQPIRLDREQFNNKIDDEIIAAIRRARFVVADFTQADSGARGGVYYEAGFAHGRDIPVIFTCRENAISQVHFDTRQYNHITWATPDDLRKRLAERISATIGDGPFRKTS